MTTPSSPSQGIPVNRGHLLTEQTNAASQFLDQLTPLAFVDLVNQEDQKTIALIVPKLTVDAHHLQKFQ
ncbi:MAG: hypothetical protein F6K42_18355 [Leptolyngbya sp. SIO1D8]|nr:hypothetical protein [Leptolyngbya sp. SIO1D8]